MKPKKRPLSPLERTVSAIIFVALFLYIMALVAMPIIASLSGL